MKHLQTPFAYHLYRRSPYHEFVSECCPTYINICQTRWRWPNLQVTSLPRTTAVRFGNGKVSQTCRSRSNPRFVSQNNAHGLFFGAGGFSLTPTSRSTTAVMLY